jgi:hypothetical protein
VSLQQQLPGPRAVAQPLRALHRAGGGVGAVNVVQLSCVCGWVGGWGGGGGGVWGGRAWSRTCCGGGARASARAAGTQAHKLQRWRSRAGCLCTHTHTHTHTQTHTHTRAHTHTHTHTHLQADGLDGHVAALRVLQAGAQDARGHKPAPVWQDVGCVAQGCCIRAQQNSTCHVCHTAKTCLCTHGNAPAGCDADYERWLERSKHVLLHHGASNDCLDLCVRGVLSRQGQGHQCLGDSGAPAQCGVRAQRQQQESDKACQSDTQAAATHHTAHLLVRPEALCAAAAGGAVWCSGRGRSGCVGHGVCGPQGSAERCMSEM